MAQATRPTTQRKTTTTTTRTRTATNTGARPFNMPFESMNIYYILGGIAVIAIGYLIMGSGDALSSMSLNVSPLVLLLGYLVIVPMGIMYGSRRRKKTETVNTKTTSL